MTRWAEGLSDKYFLSGATEGVKAKQCATAEKSLRFRVLLASCLVPLTLGLLSSTSQAACTVTSSGVSMNVAGVCVAPDGTYTGAGANFIFNASAGTIQNTGNITLQKGTSSVAEFVRASGSGSQVLLNNLTIDPFTSSGAATYGLHSGQGTGANIVVSGLYKMTGSGTVYGAAAGNLGTAGTITLNNVEINITGGNAGANLITSTLASNVLTVNGSMTLQNAATNSSAIYVADNATINLYGSGGATNTITMTGSGSAAMRVLTNSTLNATNLVTVTGTAAANISGLLVNGANGKALLSGGLTANVTGTAVTASGGGTVTLRGTSSLTTSQDNAHGVYATGAGSTITLETININTTGKSAYGAYATVAGSTITLETANIITTGESAHGIYSTVGAAVNISSGNITTYGAFSFGLYAYNTGASITATNLVIKALDSSSSAVYAMFGGTVNLSGSNISVGQAGAVGGLNSAVVVSNVNAVINLNDSSVINRSSASSTGLTALSGGQINANK